MPDFIKDNLEYQILHDRLHAIPSYYNSVSDQKWHASYFSGYDWFNSIAERASNLFHTAEHDKLSDNEIAEMRIYLEEELVDYIPGI